MSAERDTTRIVRSWLRADEHESADRVLQTVLARLDATPQRRSWWPTWRFADMNIFAKLAMAATAVLVVAIAGYSVLPGSSLNGGPGASPTSVPSPGPIPTGSMAPGTYLVTNPGLTLIPYSLTVPAGWIGGDGARRGDDSLGNGVRLTTWIITHVYSNSCQWTGTLLPVADKPALVAALTSQQGHAHTAPVETTVGGIAATRITFSLDAAFDVATCDKGSGTNGIVRLWPDPGPDEGGGWLITPGQTTTAYVIEAKGRVMVLMTVQRQDSPPADVAALQQILESVDFQPLTP